MTGLTVTSHAAERIKQRFGISWKRVDEWARDQLAQATYVGEYVDEDGKVTRLFGRNGICFVLDREDAVLITVYERRVAPEVLRNAVGQVVADQLAKVERKVSRLARRHARAKAELKIAAGEAELSAMSTRSEARRIAYTAFARACNAHPAVLDADMGEAKRELSLMRKGATVYV